MTNSREYLSRDIEPPNKRLRITYCLCTMDIFYPSKIALGIRTSLYLDSLLAKRWYDSVLSILDDTSMPVHEAMIEEAKSKLEKIYQEMKQSSQKMA